MKLVSSKIFLISMLVLLLAFVANGQSNGRNRQEPLPKKLRERLAKMQIEEEKKDFEKLLTRSEEVAKLSEEIQTSYKENSKLTSEDQEKLKRVGKLLKKIRQELKAGKPDKEKDTEEIKSTSDALKSLQENTSKLFKAVKKTTRHTVSVVAIQSSNTVLSVLKFLKLKK